MRSRIWGDRPSRGANQWKSLGIFIQISLTPSQVVTDVCQALEYSTWKAHVHINQRNFEHSGHSGHFYTLDTLDTLDKADKEYTLDKVDYLDKADKEYTFIPFKKKLR